VGELAGSFGLNADTPSRRPFGEKRSYFLRNMLTDLIFPEAGLGTFDAAAEERRKWLWRGSLAGASLLTLLAGLLFLFSFPLFRGIDDQNACWPTSPLSCQCRPAGRRPARSGTRSRR
jgi:type VI secretion system protein ImpL